MLSGRVALVTGSTRGIGLGILKAFAKEGANVTIHGIEGDDPDVVELSQHLMAENRIEVLRSRADLTRPDEIRRLIDNIHDRFGRLDILVTSVLHTCTTKRGVAR